ncbi:ABC transporter permease [Sphingomonas crusticola]|uniref:ABC transporter permease n=1 Tax=Sphingomonas crusticola TaxID=1697973 RepID=UPI000E222D6B|nr:ABC transporter permease [Sphingomonas crusticola]
MNSYGVILQLAFSNVLRYSSRSFLTALGITVSVASLVLVVALVQGVSSSVTSSFDNLGASVLTVQSQTSFADQLLGKRNRLTFVDYTKLTRAVRGVTNMVPAFFPYGGGAAEVRFGNRSTSTRVLAVSPMYQDTYKVYPALGRFFTAGDEQSKRKVCVIGDRVRKDLKLGRNPIGQFLNISGSWFKIVGVMEARGEIFGISQDDYVLMPFSTGETELANVNQQDINIAMNVRNVDEIKQVQDRIETLLRGFHNLKPRQDNDFTVMTARQLTESISTITNMLTIVFGGMIGISMLVGGIGIMNIMLASVNERVREIGICKALGAQRHHILLQFLAEAGIISTLGGIVGLMIGGALAYAATLLVPALGTVHMPLWAVILSLGFSTLVGLFFGVTPAAHAASLDPIEALRYE